MEELKAFLEANCKIPFMLRKNSNKFYKGFSHVIYLKYVWEVDGLREKLHELGFVHTPYLAEGGKYCTRMYIKQVSDEPLPPTPQDMYLWTCPECGNLYYVRKEEKRNIIRLSTSRTVCDDCVIEYSNLHKKFGGTINKAYKTDEVNT